MKPRLFLITVMASIAALFIASCKSKSNSSLSDSTNLTVSNGAKSKVESDTWRITLNGVDSTNALAMTGHFKNYKKEDSRPLQKSVWFDKKTFHLIVRILEKERGKQVYDAPVQKGMTDGLRIYFASDPTSSTGQLNNSIVLVSTKNNGLDNTVPSKAYHLDYYDHKKDDSLFMDMTAIKGVISTRPKFPINLHGENLYNPHLRLFESENISCSDPHFITRGRANKMANRFGKDTITTLSEWFDLKLLELIDRDTIHDGVRIYFARHPDKYKSKIDTDVNKEAFLLITTKYHYNKLLKKETHDDYFDCKWTGNYFLYVKKVLGWYNKLHAFDGTGGGDDNGELCPTHCP
ncbi:MAG TPA: hypothetical protein VHB54_20855 [Mucilaginibacter sp.]|nr:hypothetical protein [Mucilaginibacter sp.]